MGGSFLYVQISECMEYTGSTTFPSMCCCWAAPSCTWLSRYIQMVGCMLARHLCWYIGIYSVGTYSCWDTHIRARVNLMIWAGNAFKPKRPHFVSSLLAGAAYVCASYSFSRKLILFSHVVREYMWLSARWTHALQIICTTHTSDTKTHTFTRAGCDFRYL